MPTVENLAGRYFRQDPTSGWRSPFDQSSRSGGLWPGVFQRGCLLDAWMIPRLRRDDPTLRIEREPTGRMDRRLAGFSGDGCRLSREDLDLRFGKHPRTILLSTSCRFRWPPGSGVLGCSLFSWCGSRAKGEHRREIVPLIIRPHSRHGFASISLRSQTQKPSDWGGAPRRWNDIRDEAHRRGARGDHLSSRNWTGRARAPLEDFWRGITSRRSESA